MTAAKLAANRNNARSSTGPNDTQRTRFNGMQHGLTSRQNVIPGESQQEYDAYHQKFLADLNPQSSLETALAERTIAAAWRMQRFQRVEAAFFNNRMDAFLGENPDADPDSALANLFVDPAETARFRLFLRYQNSVLREFDKALSEFKNAKAEREQNEMDAAIQNSVSSVETPVKTEAASAVGFASQAAPQSEFHSRMQMAGTAETASLCAA